MNPSTIEFIDLLSSFGLDQQVHVSTHEKGGTLDVVIAGNNIDSLAVDIEEVRFSDHHLVSWSLDIGAFYTTYDHNQ